MTGDEDMRGATGWDDARWDGIGLASVARDEMEDGTGWCCGVWWKLGHGV